MEIHTKKSLKSRSLDRLFGLRVADSAQGESSPGQGHSPRSGQEEKKMKKKKKKEKKDEGQQPTARSGSLERQHGHHVVHSGNALVASIPPISRSGSLERQHGRRVIAAQGDDDNSSAEADVLVTGVRSSGSRERPHQRKVQISASVAVEPPDPRTSRRRRDSPDPQRRFKIDTSGANLLTAGLPPFRSSSLERYQRHRIHSAIDSTNNNNNKVGSVEQLLLCASFERQHRQRIGSSSGHVNSVDAPQPMASNGSLERRHKHRIQAPGAETSDALQPHHHLQQHLARSLSFEMQHGHRVSSQAWDRDSSQERHHGDRRRTTHGRGRDRERRQHEQQQAHWPPLCRPDLSGGGGSSSNQEGQACYPPGLPECGHWQPLGAGGARGDGGVLGGSVRPGGYTPEGDRQSSKDGKDTEPTRSSKQQSWQEQRVEELSRQLDEEKHNARKAIAKLQRELARLKSERSHYQRDGRDGVVVKELERERMLRLETEQRLLDMRVESDSCRARLHALQDEFRKMEEMVRDMLQYKTKIDQLKQEKANLAVTYENSLQKCRNHISTLERENMMLLNQVKKMESQMHGKGDDRDKSRLLLERLKMVEAENSGLVLENEQQRQQYEKCLDQIANQVVQALLAQKTLREECLKLQNRVQDLELQNRQLNYLFQHRLCFPSDPAMQQGPFLTGASSYLFHSESGRGEVTAAQFFQGSVVSLQSMFSEMTCEDGPGHPQMSTPPPWLRDRLDLPLDDDVSFSSSSTGSPPSCSLVPTSSAVQQGITSSPDSTSLGLSGPSQPIAGAEKVTTKIETEFPATNASPKVKRISVLDRGTLSLERKGLGFFSGHRGSTESVSRKEHKGKEKKIRRSSDTQAMNQLSEEAWQKLEEQVHSRQKAAPASPKLLQSSIKQSASAEGILSVKETLSSSLPSSSSASSSAGTRTLPGGSLIPVTHRTSPSSCIPRAVTTSVTNSLNGSLGNSVLRQGSPVGKREDPVKGERPGNKARGKSSPASSESGRSSSSSGKGGGGRSRRDSARSKGGSPARQHSVKLPPTPQSTPYGKVKLRTKTSPSSGETTQSFNRPGLRNSMPPSLPFHSQYYYEYSDEDSDSRPVSRIYSCASTVSLSELLDTSAEADLALDDDFFSDWSSMCLSPHAQHRLPISNPGSSSQARAGNSIHEQSISNNFVASSTQSRSSAHTSPKSTKSSSPVESAVKLHHRLNLSQVSSLQDPLPSLRGGAERLKANAKAERDDSGCEVDPSHSDRSESSMSNLQQGAEDTSETFSRQSSRVVTESGVGTALSGMEMMPTDKICRSEAASCDKPLAMAPAVCQNEDLLLSEAKKENDAAVLCTVASSTKSAARVQLPSPQAAVLIVESSCCQPDSQHKPQFDKSGSVALEMNSSTMSSSLSSTANSPNDLIASVISPETSGCIPKLRSQPLSVEEKFRVCRPDQLILAPAEKTFSVHGFTSTSSSSCEDKSSPQAYFACKGDGGGKLETPSPSENCAKVKKTPPPVPSKPGKTAPDGHCIIATTASESTGDVATCSRFSSSTAVNCNISNNASHVSVISSDGGQIQGGKVNNGENRTSGHSASWAGKKFPPDTNLMVGFVTVQAPHLENLPCHANSVRDMVSTLVKETKERVARGDDWPVITTAVVVKTTTDDKVSTAFSGSKIPSTTMTPHTSPQHGYNNNPYKSLDSSFESLRADRSGSKDDGYSTMSSDIHPSVAMEKYSYPENLVSKATEVVPASLMRKSSDPFPTTEHSGSSCRLESLRRQERSVEMSETDSAMETSTHSIDARNSCQTLCSQVLSSSGENVLSPINKVSRMARFFEDEASKGCTRTSAVPHSHKASSLKGPGTHSVGTPSPLSPLGLSVDSSPVHSPYSNLPSLSSVTSPESDDSSSQQMCVSVVSRAPFTSSVVNQATPLSCCSSMSATASRVSPPAPSAILSVTRISSVPVQTCVTPVTVSAAVCCTSSVTDSASLTSVTFCSPSVTSPTSCVGQKIHDMVHGSLQTALSNKAITTASHTPSICSLSQTQSTVSHNPPLTTPRAPQRPTDLRISPDRFVGRTSARQAIVDFKKYEITDLSKVNVAAHSPVNFDTPSALVRRETVVSWPPRKNCPSYSPPATYMTGSDFVAFSQGRFWGDAVTPSPLHVLETGYTPLDDIPEESGDECDNVHIRVATTTAQKIHRNETSNLHRLRGNQFCPATTSVASTSSFINVTTTMTKVCLSLERRKRCLRKAKSESNVSQKPRVASLFDEMMTGSWDSGKILERSASVSEVDFRSNGVCEEDRNILLHNFRDLSLDENKINATVSSLLGKTAQLPVLKSVETTSPILTSAENCDTDSEMECQRQLHDLWETLMSQKPPDMVLKCKDGEEKKEVSVDTNTTPTTDLSCNADEWLRFLLPSNTLQQKNQLGPGSRNIYGLDLSQIKQSAEIDWLHIECPQAGVESANSGQCSPRSPSEEQKLFHREFYSLCPVESSRSLASSNCSVHCRSQDDLSSKAGDLAVDSGSSLPAATSAAADSIHAKEFDEISKQIASLSRTVDELNRSFNSDQEDHGQHYHLQLAKEAARDRGDEEEGEASGSSSANSGNVWAAKGQDYVDGYHWVDDEFYLTTCGGEVIIGSASFLDEDDDVDDAAVFRTGAGEVGDMFAMEDNDEAIADDAQDDFYCIRLPPRAEARKADVGNTQLPSRPMSGGSDADHILNNLVQFRYNSEGQLSQQPAHSAAHNSAAALSLQVGGWSRDCTSSHNSLCQTEASISDHIAKEAGGIAPGLVVGAGTDCEHLQVDKEHRANLLGSMLPSGGDSNDSLSSDIGLDHMMCQRLMGRKAGRMDVVRLNLPRQRPLLDPARFAPFGLPEQEAVSAFDFLEDVSTSESSENIPETGRGRSLSQPLSREVVLRQAQNRHQGKSSASGPRPASESDCRATVLLVESKRDEKGEVVIPRLKADERVASYYHHYPQQPGSHISVPQQLSTPSHPQPSRIPVKVGPSDEARRRTSDARVPQVPGRSHPEEGSKIPRCTPTPSAPRKKVKRRKTKSELDKTRADATAADAVQGHSGGEQRSRRPLPHVPPSGKGGRGRKVGEKNRHEWQDITVGGAVPNALSLSDSCCEGTSSSS